MLGWLCRIFLSWPVDQSLCVHCTQGGKCDFGWGGSLGPCTIPIPGEGVHMHSHSWQQVRWVPHSWRGICFLILHWLVITTAILFVLFKNCPVYCDYFPLTIQCLCCLFSHSLSFSPSPRPPTSPPAYSAWRFVYFIHIFEELSFRFIYQFY